MACNEVQEQDEELTVLEAIFQDDFKQLENSSLGAKHFSIEVVVKFPENLHEVLLQAWIPTEQNSKDESTQENIKASRAKMERSQSRNHWLIEQYIRILPPICFDCTFPSGYPCNIPPEFNLACSWLSSGQLTRICRYLDSLWEETPCQPIIYSWIEWLQNSLIEYFGFETDGIVLHSEEEDMGIDPRVVINEDISIQDSLISILHNNFVYTKKQFQLEKHTCEVCFEEKDGAQFSFLECGHVFCNECLRYFCELHTQSGTVENLHCPNQECDGTISPFVVHELLSSQLYQRWEQFMLQKTLDGMLDIVYCPRCNQAVISDESEREANLGHCANCFFAFCTDCLQSWHQGVPCYHQVEKQQDKKAASKRATGLNHKVNRDTFIPEDEKDDKSRSKQFIIFQLGKGTFKKCPKCKVVIEKNEGCPFMVCSRCNANFCWRCGRLWDRGHECIPINIERNLQPVPKGLLRVQELERQNHERKEFKACPRCRQKNARENNNNHMKCWGCKSNFCFHCSKVITGNISAHFSHGGPCRQHSDMPCEEENKVD